MDRNQKKFIKFIKKIIKKNYKKIFSAEMPVPTENAATKDLFKPVQQNKTVASSPPQKKRCPASTSPTTPSTRAGRATSYASR